MAKSLIFYLALAAGQMTASRAALHPYGEAHDAPYTIDPLVGGPDHVAEASHHGAQPSAYNTAGHGALSNDAPLSSTIATNGSSTVVEATLPTGAATSIRATPAVGSGAVITEIVTSYTTYCPQATAITVNNVTYSANASAVLTVSHCPGGCRITRAISEVSKPTVIAVLSRYTTSLAGPTTLSLQGTVHTITDATVLTVSRCPGGCTVTTDLQALLSSAQPAEYSTDIVTGHGAPFNGTTPTPATASFGTGGGAATTGFAAGPTHHHGDSTAPVQQTQIGAAAGKEFSYTTVVLACLVMLI